MAVLNVNGVSKSFEDGEVIKNITNIFSVKI